MLRVPCSSCGESIHPDTAAKNNGLCMPCKGGYRERIEAGKRQREEDRKYEQSAERKYWLRLVSQIHESTDGSNGLTSNERTYFALGCLVGEVYNGGLHQFFFNSSGAMYGTALDGLFEIEANETAGLLSRAKELLFGGKAVPVDTSARRALLQQRGMPAELEELDQAFWKNGEKLDARCREYAATHRLYGGA
jgi:hypothetical protein